jgi:hypothetical protein
MKLSTDKRNKLIGVAIGTVAVISLLWYYLILSQTHALAEAAKKITDAQDRAVAMRTSIKLADKIQAEVDSATENMREIEKEMASGDLYSWMYNTIKDFKSPYRVDILQFSTVEVADCNLIYKFPFRQAKMGISGNGYFHDIGKFISDFENHFPHMRIQNVEMSPGSGGNSDREKLGFRMEIVALIKGAD